MSSALDYGHPSPPQTPRTPGSAPENSLSSLSPSSPTTAHDTDLDHTLPTCYTFAPPPVYILRPIAANTDAQAYAIICWLNNVYDHCESCYFLGHRRPVKIIETDGRGGIWETDEYHERWSYQCPWGLLHPDSDYTEFNREVYSAFRESSLTRGTSPPYWTVCYMCGAPWQYPDDHECCYYGQSLTKIAFLIWEFRSVRDIVLSYLVSAGAEVPDFHCREDYAKCLGSNADSLQPTLHHIHDLVIAYDVLRRGNVLPQCVTFTYH